MPKIGYKQTEEHIRKASESRMGRKHSEEAKKKMCIAKIGHIPWNKGIKMPFDKIRKGYVPSEKTLKKMSEARKGLPSGFKGKHFSEEAKERNRIAHLGLKFSEETKQKMREIKKQNPPKFQFKKGNISWNTGIKLDREKLPNMGHFRSHSEETKRKIGDANWRGGISKLPYPFEFNNELKESIRKRDNYKCQLCGAPQIEFTKKLPVHHIDYNKENLEDTNLITLCGRCNPKVNANRKYWTEYFSKIIEGCYA